MSCVCAAHHAQGAGHRSGSCFYRRCAGIVPRGGNNELAIGVGWLVETSQQAWKIGSFRQLLVASPSMASQVARLNRPDDIAALPFVASTALRDALSWNFSLNDIERQAVNVQASIFLDATLAVREAVCHGAGFLCSRTTRLQTILRPVDPFTPRIPRSCRGLINQGSG
jgi:hypothetical protein